MPFKRTGGKGSGATGRPQAEVDDVEFGNLTEDGVREYNRLITLYSFTIAEYYW